MPTDKQRRRKATKDEPAIGQFAITPSDASELDYITSGIFVGVGGTLVLDLADASGDTQLTYANVPSGAFLPLAVRKVWLSGTSASQIIGLW